jgi:hypothetical protein
LTRGNHSPLILYRIIPVEMLSLSSLLLYASTFAGSTAEASSTDWLVTRCVESSSFVEVPGGFVLNNSIVSRTFRTTCASTLYTESIRSEASGTEKLVAAAPEATLLVQGIPVFVGGLGSGNTSSVQLTFSGYRTGLPLERYPFTPGMRGSHVTAWPPSGIRVSLDHTAPCAAIVNETAGTFNVSVSYELYDSVAAFGKSIAISHNCSADLQLLNMTTDLLALAAFDAVSFFTDAAIADTGTDSGAWWVRYHSVMGFEGGSPTYGPGSILAAGDAFASFLTLEVVHDGSWPVDSQRGMSRFGLELSRSMRVVAPQIEQYPILAELMCVGGGELPEDDPRQGYWCYDDSGTAGVFAFIDQAAEAGVDMVLLAQVP